MLVYNHNSVSRHIQNVEGGYVIQSTIIKSNTKQCRMPVMLEHKRIFPTLAEAEIALQKEAKSVIASRKFIVSWNHPFSFTVDKTNGEHWIFPADKKTS
ncbi:MAG TPA: hypothetical protein PLP33_24525 [Leptospiraceae bacterium]|nr:hypothetical protein [Leptospiraceae bacterium]